MEATAEEATEAALEAALVTLAFAPLLDAEIEDAVEDAVEDAAEEVAIDETTEDEIDEACKFSESVLPNQEIFMSPDEFKQLRSLGRLKHPVFVQMRKRTVGGDLHTTEDAADVDSDAAELDPEPPEPAATKSQILPVMVCTSTLCWSLDSKAGVEVTYSGHQKLGRP